MLNAYSLQQDSPLARRSRLYVLAYWALALHIVLTAVNPNALISEFWPLALIGMTLCAGMALRLGFEASHGMLPAEARETPGPMASSATEKVLKVQIERRRIQGRPLAVLIAEVSSEKSNPALQAEAGKVVAAAHELLRRYIEGEESVKRLTRDRVAAVMAGSVTMHELERLVDRLNEDMRAWTRSSLGRLLELNVGVVIDWQGRTSPDLLVRQVNIAVRRAAISGRGRYVIAENLHR